jgi:hypothetical protein
MKFVPIDSKKKNREMRGYKNTKFLYAVYRISEKDSQLFGYIIEPKILKGLHFWACGQEQWLMPFELTAIARFMEELEVKRLR